MANDHDAIIPPRLMLKWPWPPRGDRTLAELAEQFNVHPNQIQTGNKNWSPGLKMYWGRPAEAADHEQVQQKLHAKIGQLTMEKDFLANALGHGR